jgi:hypothetical protein
MKSKWEVMTGDGEKDGREEEREKRQCGGAGEVFVRIEVCMNFSHYLKQGTKATRGKKQNTKFNVKGD